MRPAAGRRKCFSPLLAAFPPRRTLPTHPAAPLVSPPLPLPLPLPISTIREDIDKKRLQKQGVVTKTVSSPKPQPAPAAKAAGDSGPNYAVAAAVALLVPLVAWLALGGGQ